VLKKLLFTCILLVIFIFYINAQTHISVPLESPIYIILEQAQMRGLLGFQPGVKPYSRAKILLLIDEILENNENRRFGRLSDDERRILEQFKIDLNPTRDGLDLIRGTISFDHIWNDVYFSGEFGFGLDMTFAGSVFPVAGSYKFDGIDPVERNDINGWFDGASHPAKGDFYSDVSINIPYLSFIGDLGENLSYGLTLIGFIGKSPRAVLGTYFNTDKTANKDGEIYRKEFFNYSEPLAHFPFTYKKRWDSFTWPYNNIRTSGMEGWPNGMSIGYTMMPELSGTFLNGHFIYRFARLDREWAGMTANGSLVLNQNAQPFLAIETVIQPFNWISISSLTGVLEYDSLIRYVNRKKETDLEKAAETFQNAFSIVMLELNYLNYFKFDIGSSVVWPKRFELGYLFPFADNLLYQNNIGDFDNMALFLNLQGQYPGLGKLWFSLFLDELSVADIKRSFELSRMLFAFQLGASFHLPWLPFSSITLSYTKNEPYNYSHPTIETPWYQSDKMETNFVNFGRALGHYIPPNSDELLIRFDIMPNPKSVFSFQYQLIRHGADYGDRAVLGSSLWSELRSDRLTTTKYFLKDGAYQWMHILKLSGEYSFTGMSLPVKAFAQAGFVNSYFTDISGEPNTNPGSYKVIDTPQYPHSLSFIAMIGVQIFPKF